MKFIDVSTDHAGSLGSRRSGHENVVPGPVVNITIRLHRDWRRASFVQRARIRMRS